MYDIRQFRPALYAMVLLGFLGFCIAFAAPGLWLFATGATIFNAWLLFTARFRPMPRLLANFVTVGGLLVLAAVIRGVNTPIMVIGEFLTMLQLVKFYEQRSNRDYAQLIVLSWLLMVAASISTASLVFAAVLIVWLIIGLYCCLLFHLKVETDHARVAIGVGEERLSPATLRQDQRFLPRSMRRLTVLVAVYSVTIAVVTFLLIPRGTGAGLLGPMPWKPDHTLTGFSDSVSFQNVARITQDNRHIAYVKLLQDGQPQRLLMPLMLRGMTLETYSGSAPVSGGLYQWTRNQPVGRERELNNDKWEYFSTYEATQGMVQEIELEPTGTNALFAAGGVTAFNPDNPGDPGHYRFNRSDELIQTTEASLQKLRYQVIARQTLVNGREAIDDYDTDRETGRADASQASQLGPAKSQIDPKITEFARRPAVCGSNERGSLAAQRGKAAAPHPLDIQIAGNFESYLRTNFSYTLDLTDARRIENQDPLVAFLYDLKRGHCEYFAGAMTLMCQSLGMNARMVVGFACDEYNSIGNYYDVNQSQAHAWVEVLGSDNLWHSFDPTSGLQAPAGGSKSLWQRSRTLFNYLEYMWGNSVVAYDRESRNNILNKVDSGLTASAGRGNELVSRLRDWLTKNVYVVSSTLIGAMIAAMSLTIFMLISAFLVRKWRLRRRARRIGLDALPTSERLKLARQLAFYDELVRLLARRRIPRQAHQTPLEFSDSLTFLPVEVFDAIRRLTDVYYRVRYGKIVLTSLERRQLINAIDDVEAGLN